MGCTHHLARSAKGKHEGPAGVSEAPETTEQKSRGYEKGSLLKLNHLSSLDGSLSTKCSVRKTTSAAIKIQHASKNKHEGKVNPEIQQMALQGLTSASEETGLVW